MVSPILMLIADTSVTFTATVVIAGITIVVGVLLLLILVFQIFGIIAPKIEKSTKAREEKRAAKKAAKKAAKLAMKKNEKADAADNGVSAKAVSTPSPSPAPVVEQGISGEVVAAITAAIVASEGTGVTVRSIKKKKVSGRNPWAQAANIDNTRPF
ncbi:MAG: OadG family protein [Clostridium sp.]|nr:OadG family protein [Clostridium sp.]